MAKSNQTSTKTAPTTSADKRFFYFSTLLLIAACVFAVLTFMQRGESASPDSSASTPFATLPAEIKANFTAVPDSGIAPIELTKLSQAVTECPAYSAERRQQMEQHLAWLANPAQITVDLLPAFGANPSERLVFGMATYTSIEWRLADRPADSCLLPIGQALNTLLAQFGTEPFKEFGD